MKSPEQLSIKLAKQWLSADQREKKLMGQYDWPIKLSIGQPTSHEIKHQQNTIRQHLNSWRTESIGHVEWKNIKYQSASSAINLPVYWLLKTPSEWIQACRKNQVSHEFEHLAQLIHLTDKRFHSIIIRQQRIWKNQPETIKKCSELALKLTPGIADGKPIRAISLANIDSKFIEKNRPLLIKFLNTIYPDAIKEDHLEQFLGAAEDSDQWLLVIPLADELLPFKQLRLRTSDIAELDLPGSHLLIIENEQCRFQLPKLSNTIAILGAGLNLSWMRNILFKKKHIAYWGDIDTWGFKMLAMARKAQSHLEPLMMDMKSFKENQQSSVKEPQVARIKQNADLTEKEFILYNYLISIEKGRLEQEFIDSKYAEKIITQWFQKSV